MNELIQALKNVSLEWIKYYERKHNYSSLHVDIQGRKYKNFEWWLKKNKCVDIYPMTKKRKLNVKLKIKNKHQSRINIEIDISKIAKSWSSNQIQQNQPPSAPSIIMQASQQALQSGYSNIVYHVTK